MLITSTPRNNSQGTDDQSGVVEPPMSPDRPRFLPHFFFRAEKGTTEKTTANYATAVQIFGAETFNMDGKYYNHATVFMEGIMKSPCICELERIVDPNVVVKSNVTLWVDIALKDIPVYERNHDGSYVIGSDGEPVATDDTIEGYEYKVYYSYKDNESIDADLPEPDRYKEVVRAGFMTDKNDEASTMYPIFTLIGASVGEVLNKEGFSIGPMTGDNTDETMTETLGVYPFSFYRYSTYTSVKKPVNHIYGSNDVKICFKPKTADPVTKIRLNLESYLPSYWTNKDDKESPMKFSDIDEPIVYYDYIETLSTKLFENEQAYITTEVQTWSDDLDASTSEWFEFEADENGALDGQETLMNILTGVSTKNVNYFTVVESDDDVELSDSFSETAISSAVTIYMNGGTDGELDDDLFNAVVRSKLDNYLDRDNIINEQSQNPESVIIDSGYPLETSLKISNVLSYRRDLVPVISVHTVNEDNKVYELAEEIAVLQLIKNTFKLFPESEYYGTEQAKTIVCLGTGRIKGSAYPYRVPLTYDIAMKMAAMMGASNGKWKRSKLFSGFNHNEIVYLEDVTIGGLPTPTYSTVPLLWKAGGTWPQTKDKGISFTPAVQTIYDDTTSVLNNPVVAFAISVIEKAHENCWEEHSGTTDMTELEFVESVEKFMSNELYQVFDGVVTVTSKCIITGIDRLLGYSYNLVSDISANVMKTSQYSHIIAKRAGE
jgi:hypothetical protein